MTAWLLMILGISSRTLQSDSSIALSVAKAHVIRSLVLAKSHQMPRRTYLRKSVGVGGGARFRRKRGIGFGKLLVSSRPSLKDVPLMPSGSKRVVDTYSSRNCPLILSMISPSSE